MTYRIVNSGTDRSAWLDARRAGVTATDVARLASGGAAVVEAIKAEKAGLGRDLDTPAMRHGRDREPVIAAYAEATFALSHSTALIASADRPEHMATPDMLGAKTVGEIKTTVHDWQTIADVPKRYHDQMQWEMHVTEATRCFLIFEPHEGFIPLYPDPRHFIIPRDDDRIGELVTIADEFLASNVQADPDAAELDALVSAYADADEIASPLIARRDKARAAIEKFLNGEPRKFAGSRALVTRSADSIRKSFSQAALKADHPDVVDAYTIEQPVKGRLTITLRGAE